MWWVHWTFLPLGMKNRTSFSWANFAPRRTPELHSTVNQLSSTHLLQAKYLDFSCQCKFLRKSVCTGVKSLEACQHQIDLIPKRPIPPVLEPEPIRFTVTSFQLNNRGSPNSGPNSKVRSPNSSLQGLTPAAWIIRADQAPLQRPINGNGVQIPQTLPGWSC